MSVRLRARWLFPVARPPVANGVIEVEDGVVTTLHDRPDPTAVDLDNVAIVPAFVNAHAHLEFGDLDAPLEPARPFTAWIRRLLAYRREREVAHVEAVRLGLAESREAGVGVVGEIATEGWSPAAFDGRGPAATVFRELIALAPERFDVQLEIAREHLTTVAGLPCNPPGDAAASTLASPNVSRSTPDCMAIRLLRGLSPHAPYSVHPELYGALVDLAAAHDAPVAVHLAETVAELELLSAGTGELADMLREFGVWNETAFRPGSRPLDFLEPLAQLDHALVVHGNYLSTAELAFLARHPQLALVFCPRTHAFFGHAGHPWRELLAAGGTVAIGTDGRGSNPDLSVFRELQFLHARFPEVDPRILLEMATLHGARALGRAAEFGTLAVGRPARFAIVRLPEGEGEPHDLLLHADARVIGVERQLENAE
jgi:aminodeoxyfutalosine deaminase